MRLWRNPEVRRDLIFHGLLTLGLALVGLLLSPAAAGLLLAAGAAFGVLRLFSLRRRYRDLADLSAALDRVLHGQDPILEDQREGELAILRSEIGKMTLRLRESADRLAAEKSQLARLLADVSHQLRTPLTAMNLTVSLLEREELEPQRRLELTRELKRSLGRIDWMVETLLKLSRLDAGVVRFEPVPISAAELAERSLRSFRIPMELRGLEMKLDLGETALVVDPAWTAEALGNLIKNALEHTPPGGILTLAARQTPIFTELTLTDTGPGFDPEDLPHLFDRFYRGKNASETSVGIGLALARQIITAQNGTILGENAPEGGARFQIRFYSGVV